MAGTQGEVVEFFFEKVESCGSWPQQACATMFFLIPKNVTTEKTPLRFCPTLIRWWECLRALEVSRLQERRRVGWDAADGRNGGAERTVWETLPEMHRLDNRAGERYQAAITLVPDLATALERESLPVVWDWASHFNLRKKILHVQRGYFEHRRRVQFAGCVAEPLQTITAILPGSKRSCLALRIVLQDALSEVMKVYPPLTMMVQDITAFMEG